MKLTTDPKKITKAAFVQELVFYPPALGNTAQWDRASLHSASSVKRFLSSEKKYQRIFSDELMQETDKGELQTVDSIFFLVCHGNTNQFE